MVKSTVAEGELGEAIEKLNESLIEALSVHRREAIILSIVIQEGMIARKDQLLDFVDEWADIGHALNELKVATDKAEHVRADYLQAASAKKARKEGRSPLALAIQKFRRENGMMKDHEQEEYDRNATLKAQQTGN